MSYLLLASRPNLYKTGIRANHIKYFPMTKKDTGKWNQNIYQHIITSSRTSVNHDSEKIRVMKNRPVGKSLYMTHKTTKNTIYVIVAIQVKCPTIHSHNIVQTEKTMLVSLNSFTSNRHMRNNNDIRSDNPKIKLTIIATVGVNKKMENNDLNIM